MIIQVNLNRLKALSHFAEIIIRHNILLFLLFCEELPHSTLRIKQLQAPRTKCQ